MRKHNWMVLGFLSILCACGGGGGSAGTETTPPPTASTIQLDISGYIW